ncbi:MAG TPA: tetratricopeptide repeat protein [Elusimicrobiota bacterium]|nr:tetratricopeptide repeat protein [Elusimicrobiota bacterium]
MPPPDKKKKDAPPAKKQGNDIIELGKFYFLNGKLDEALQEFNKALALEPHNAEIHYNLGLIHESKNDRDKAQESYKTALSFNPAHKLSQEHLNRLIGINPTPQNS